MSPAITSKLATLGRILGLTAAVLFFLFPVFWVVLMSFQSKADILRVPPSIFFSPTLANYKAIFTGVLETSTGSQQIEFLRNLGNSALLSSMSVLLALVLGVPAAYAFARYSFRLGEDIAFTLLSFRFAPPLLVLLPLTIYFGELGLNDSYISLIWVYQLIILPLVLWIIRGYFEDIAQDIEHAYRMDGNSWLRTFFKISIPLAKPGIAAAGLLAFIYAWNNFIFALVLASADKQPVTVGALLFVTGSGIQYGHVAAATVLSVAPILTLALFVQQHLVEGLSLGAIKG